MEYLAWTMLVAAPLIVCAVAGLLFPRAWQRVVFSGAGAAGIYAAVLYSMQSDMARRGGLSADPLRVASEVGLVTLPLGMLAGFVLHLLARFLRNRLPSR